MNAPISLLADVLPAAPAGAGAAISNGADGGAAFADVFSGTLTGDGSADTLVDAASALAAAYTADDTADPTAAATAGPAAAGTASHGRAGRAGRSHAPHLDLEPIPTGQSSAALALLVPLQPAPPSQHPAPVSSAPADAQPAAAVSQAVIAHEAVPAPPAVLDQDAEPECEPVTSSADSAPSPASSVAARPGVHTLPLTDATSRPVAAAPDPVPAHRFTLEHDRLVVSRPGKPESPMAEPDDAAPSTVDPLVGTPVTAPATSAPAATAADQPEPAPTAADIPDTQPALGAALGRLRSHADGTHEISVALHPAELGKVGLTATVRDGALIVTVACADHAAHEAVRAALPSLHSDLANAGFTAVDVTLSGGGAQPDSRPAQSQQAWTASDQPAAARDDAGDTADPTRRGRPAADAALDRWL